MSDDNTSVSIVARTAVEAHRREEVMTWEHTSFELRICRSSIKSLLRVFLLLMAAGALAQQRDLTQLSIEDLMNLTVTSASKKEQKLEETAAAVYIITQEDIRHSGMTSVPELLRMVP